MADEKRPPIGAPVVDATAAERSRALAEAAQEAAAHPRDETIPGGRYLVGDRLVNADGEPLAGQRD